MNQILARWVAVLNGLIALVLIVAGALAGSVYHVAGHFFGLVVGFFVALMACGSVALVIQIHDELKRIRMALERSA